MPFTQDEECNSSEEEEVSSSDDEDEGFEGGGDGGVDYFTQTGIVQEDEDGVVDDDEAMLGGRQSQGDEQHGEPTIEEDMLLLSQIYGLDKLPEEQQRKTLSQLEVTDEKEQEVILTQLSQQHHQQEEQDRLETINEGDKEDSEDEFGGFPSDSFEEINALIESCEQHVETKEQQQQAPARPSDVNSVLMQGAKRRASSEYQKSRSHQKPKKKMKKALPKPDQQMITKFIETRMAFPDNHVPSKAGKLRTDVAHGNTYRSSFRSGQLLFTVLEIDDDQVIVDTFMELKHTFIGLGDQSKHDIMVKYNLDKNITDHRGRPVYSQSKIPINILGEKVDSFKEPEYLYTIHGPSTKSGNNFHVSLEEISSAHVPRKIPLNHKPRIIDICMGPGGASLGAEQAGFDHVCGVDMKKDACDTVRLNEGIHRGRSIVFCGSDEQFLQQVEADEKVEIRYLPDLRLIQIIHFSTPCQGFSQKNRGGKNDEKNRQVTRRIILIIRKANCPCFTIENVAAIWHKKHRHYIQYVIEEAAHLGYKCRAFIRSCGDYGDPQLRSRAFFYFVKKGMVLPQVPDPVPPSERETSAQCLRRNGLDRISPSKIGVDGRIVLSNGKEAFGHSVEGTALAKNPMENIHLSQRIGKNAPAITTGNKYKHPTQNRNLTILELKRHFNFPDTYRFAGSYTSQRKQIGDAVPVKTAKHIFGAFLRETFDLKESS